MGDLSLLGHKLDYLLECLRETHDIPGAMAELGVYKGGTARAMLDVCPHKELSLFDTFCGMPEQGSIDIHRVGEFADTSLEAVKALFSEGRGVLYWVGKFPDSAPPPSNYSYSFVHLDADQYQVTRDGLEYFWPKMSAGGIMVLDDYGWRNCPGIKVALGEWMTLAGGYSLEIRGNQAVIRKDK